MRRGQRGGERTGMGSKMVTGFQSTSEMTWRARVGEQMKCRVAGWARRVPCKSRGSSLKRGVRYWKLWACGQGVGTDERKVGPAGVAPVQVEGTGGLAIGVLAEEPHGPVGEEVLLDVAGEIKALVDDHADAGGGQPGGGQRCRGAGRCTDQMRAPIAA